MKGGTVEYFVRIAAWLSQGINCVVLGGSPDQTVSARAYVLKDMQGWSTVYWLLNKIFFFQKDHCRSSHEADLAFARQILGYQ